MSKAEQLYKNDGSKTPISPIIDNPESISNSMIGESKLDSILISKIGLYDFLVDKMISNDYVTFNPNYSFKNTMINASNGNEETYQNCNSTDYISTKFINKIKLVKGAKWYNLVSITLFDVNKNFIDYFPKNEQATSIVDGDIYLAENLIIDISENVRYMRITDKITSLVNTNIQLLEKIINPIDSKKPWIGKKWVCIGDSLTELNKRSNKQYYEYVSEETGIEVINRGVSGSGYYRRKNDGNAFFQRIDSIPTDVDVVTIFGSGNDINEAPFGTINDTGTETICGCINTTLDLLIKRFLDAGKAPVIGVISPTPWAGSNFTTYCSFLKEICKLKSIPFYDLYYKSNLHPDNVKFRQLFYSRDDGNGVHPDENGHKIIAPHFKAFLESILM